MASYIAWRLRIYDTSKWLKRGERWLIGQHEYGNHSCVYVYFRHLLVGVGRCSGKGLYATYILWSIDLSIPDHKIMELTSCSVQNLKDKTPLGSFPLLDASFGRSLDPRTVKHPYAVIGIKHELHWNVLFFKDTGIHQNISFKKTILWLCVFFELFENIPFPLILNIVNWFPKYLGPPERRKISRSKSETSRDGRDSENSEFIASLMHEWEHTQCFSRYLMETKGHLHTTPNKYFNKTTNKMFSVHTTRRKFETSTITGGRNAWVHP